MLTPYDMRFLPVECFVVRVEEGGAELRLDVAIWKRGGGGDERPSEGKTAVED
jgi:hypothetical protein